MFALFVLCLLMVYLIVVNLIGNLLMNSYAKILMSNWSGISKMKILPDTRPGLIDSDEMNVLYPKNLLTGNRDADIVRAMDARTPPVVRQQILANIDTIPPDQVNPNLSDDDKLSVMKSRYCQSRPELADYGDYLEKIAEQGIVSDDSSSNDVAHDADDGDMESSDDVNNE